MPNGRRCWICLQSAEDPPEVRSNCSCPDTVVAHPKCLAVWQAVSSDTKCRVCGDVLPEWGPVLLGRSPKDIEVTVGSVTKTFNNTTTTGSQRNLRNFQGRIRRAFSLRQEDVTGSENVSFVISVPDIEHSITLRGWEHFQTVFGQ
jgi:hypothetical protein